ncbi:MAG: hypothetical protein ACR2MZ_13050, partial [Candidatus Dormibacter sp.]|uniref:hypothetical protein n=1 Tax=Candidatus Dormibacter sp. TaxID=2973982 RepID=UPI003D9B12ED
GEGRPARRRQKGLEAFGSDVRFRHRHNTDYLVFEPAQARRRAGTKAAQAAQPKKRGRPRKVPAVAGA